MTGPSVGFVGLGNMGGALAANVAATGVDLVVHDAAGPARAPQGTTFVEDVASVARAAEVVVLSLPDGTVSEKVTAQLADATDRRVTLVIDTSTIGVSAAGRITDLLAARGIGHVDAPVSGGVAGARARTLTVMYAGTDEACARAEPVLAALTDRRRRVGERPGLAQALKLANNFLAAVALAATSEAVAFGTAAGLDMATMLDVLNSASGQNNATAEKFPRQVLTGNYAAGFTNSLMAKDLRLYLGEVRELDGPLSMGTVTSSLWEAFADAEPGVDFTRIYPYVRGD
ncbi:3-hydroxyisobutyrate dehydrogenase [Parafrankia irregularis]|uniref:3-hydroxyisobutyrate dehydrogenase n=1 Tax=Parafrankia irregularis TaxID=795642 RepID=A0A0S4QP62_9ACTN|nr:MULTISPECIES: NAD(P)-dependent oxidoreductase [Parafrankia]MBE3201259.1 NAD(P)-dependent oxidoreductase [Parafrankia sp. CH37]CUU56294.1 3-hydroxyisobutyrate dehydrogenase [Parafrankia irregularis]